jgi:hypothetical protein
VSLQAWWGSVGQLVNLQRWSAIDWLVEFAVAETAPSDSWAAMVRALSLDK